MPASDIEFRTFRNTDPPQLLRLWHACALDQSAAEGFSCDALEAFVFSTPYFDPKGLQIAESNDRIVAMAHAGFSANDDGSDLDQSKGTISALMVEPSHRRQQLGHELVARCEAYLRSAGAKEVSVGGGSDVSGFYVGLYGGVEPTGFFDESGDWHGFLGSMGYTESGRTVVLHRDISVRRDPVSARIMQHRRRLQMVVSDNITNASWWWQARFGRLPTLQCELQEKNTGDQIASARLVGLDLYLPKWQVRAIGIRDLFVPEDKRRRGYGQSLVAEVCRRLRDESIQLVEAQVPSHDEACVKLFHSCMFKNAGEHVAFRKSLDG